MCAGVQDARARGEMQMRRSLTVLVGIAAVLAIALGSSSIAQADGNGSPPECMTGLKAEGNQDLLIFDVGPGKIVTGVCIHSGSNMFGGNQHSGILVDGIYENGCYQVSGVGTQVVTVERIGTPGPNCQGLS